MHEATTIDVPGPIDLDRFRTDDEGTYRTCRDLARQCRDTGELAQQLKEMVEAGNPLSERADLYSDLMNAALADIDWHEIANGFAEDME